MFYLLRDHKYNVSRDELKLIKFPRSTETIFASIELPLSNAALCREMPFRLFPTQIVSAKHPESLFNIFQLPFVINRTQFIIVYFTFSASFVRMLVTLRFPATSFFPRRSHRCPNYQMGGEDDLTYDSKNNIINYFVR